MAERQPLPSSAPADIALTRKGERYALAALARLRAEAEEEIERLLSFLDETDVDPDLEPAGDENDEDGDREPALGWNRGEAAYGRYGTNHVGEEEEDDPAEESDAGEDIGDEEPSLGAGETCVGRMMVDGTADWPSQEVRTDPGFNQANWGYRGCFGDRVDYEAEHDGSEDSMA